MRFRLFAGVGLAALAALSVFVLGAAGAPQRAASPTAALGLPLHSCYPGNEFTVWNDFGAFRMSANGSVSDGSGDATWTAGSKVAGNLGSSIFEATPGSLRGALMSATLHVPGVAHEVHFIADCVQEADVAGLLSGAAPSANTSVQIATSAKPQQGIAFVAAFARFEGHVDLPPWSVGNNQALLTIDVEACGTPDGVPDTVSPFATPDGLGGCIAVSSPTPQGPSFNAFERVTLEHAMTCDSLKGDHYRSVIQSNNPTFNLTVKFNGPGVPFRGRAGLPTGVTPGPGKVCPGINFGI